MALLVALAIVMLLLVLTAGTWWNRTGPEPAPDRSTIDGPGRLLAAAVPWLPDERRSWGKAMLAELAHLSSPRARWRFATQCAKVAIFPPRAGGPPTAIAGLLAAAAAAATGLAMYGAPAPMRTFAITFVAVVAAFAVLIVAGRRWRPSPATPGWDITTVMLAGVAGCIVLATLTYSAAVTQMTGPANPAFGSSFLFAPNVVAVAFAVLLAGYALLALAPPRGLTTDRRARRLASAGALTFGALLAVELATGYHYDDVPMAMVATLFIFPICAALAARGRSVRAGIEAALWAGLLSALMFIVIDMAVIYTAFLGGADAQVLAEFKRSGAPSLATFWLGEDLAASAVILVLLPAMAVLLGSITAAVHGAPPRERASGEGMPLVRS